MTTPNERYQADLRKQGFLYDALQEQAVAHTQRLYQALLRVPARHSGWSVWLRGRKPAPVTGLYLWGGTGRGKTYLVDSFYECVPFADKHRVHFHRFMHDIHAQLRELPRSPDPLQIIAERLAAKLRLLCLDEFHVTDIADAMLLGGLLRALFERGVTLVATSNTAIADLYRNGLQRERFLFAIELLQRHTMEVNLQDGLDYRFQMLNGNDLFHVAAPEQGERFIAAHIHQLAPDTLKHDRFIEINSRAIHYRAMADDVIWFDFAALCDTPRSANDYLQIARLFHTVLISNIFVMHEMHDSTAKRFVHLIDALYDHQVKFIASAAAEPGRLYVGQRVAFGFERAVSRIREMGSAGYLALPHLMRADLATENPPL